MSSKDTLIYDLSTSGSSAEPNVMMKKTMLTIFDSNTTYNSGQSRISTSAISIMCTMYKKIPNAKKEITSLP